MSRNNFLDPGAGALGGIAAIGSFLLIPGLAAAIPAALGIGALVYGGKVAVSALRDGTDQDAVPAVSGPQPKRGSPAEVWSGRADKALRNMRSLVDSCDQPVIKEQVDTVALQAADAQFVVRQLASQTAAIDDALDHVGRGARDERPHLESAVADHTAPAEVVDESQRSLEAIDQQAATHDRLIAQRAGLLARLESTVRGLESLNSEIAEIIAIGRTAGAVADWGGEQRVADLREEVAGLRAGLEESQRYSNEILRSNPS